MRPKNSLDSATRRLQVAGDGCFPASAASLAGASLGSPELDVLSLLLQQQELWPVSALLAASQERAASPARPLRASSLPLAALSGDAVLQFPLVLLIHRQELQHPYVISIENKGKVSVHLINFIEQQLRDRFG